jgi:hypothetical protein
MARTTAAMKGSAGGPSADASAIAEAEAIMRLEPVQACGLIVCELLASSDGATATKLRLLSEMLPRALARCFDLGTRARRREPEANV